MAWGATHYLWKCTECGEISIFEVGQRSVCPKCGQDDGRHNNE